ncbi:helix-turn-helix domain-containing protein [Streptomyces sp. NPDC088387]|uniref:helix-turn-helix domain-containing protein n=1 Tax=Streptomyces sp. NPDC088387 TaxID=3365859 RepID=UPI00381DCFEB
MSPLLRLLDRVLPPTGIHRGPRAGTVAERIEVSLDIPTQGARLKGAERDRIARKAAELYDAGCSIESTGRRIGRSYGATRTLLLEAGVKLRSRGGMRTRFGSADR